MYYKISGLTVYVTESNLIPTEFGTSLEKFRNSACGESADIVLSIVIGKPSSGTLLLRSNHVELQRIDSKSILYSFLEDCAKCSMIFYSPREAKLFIYDGVQLSDPELSEQTRVLFRMIFEEIAAFKEMLSLHSSTFVYNNSAVCITGESGAGKSTLTRNFLSFAPDASILNGDRPVVCYENGSFMAYGAPWSGKEHIFVNDCAPVKAIVEVRQHCVNRIQKLSPQKAVKLLLKRISKPHWNVNAVFAVMGTVEKLISSVPVYRFYCVNDVSAGEFLHNTIFDLQFASFITEGEKDLKIKNNFVMRKILDNYFVIPVGSDSVAGQGAFMLNSVSAFIWEKLSKPMSRDALLDEMLNEFDVDAETAGKDLDEFLEMLRKADILEEE